MSTDNRTLLNAAANNTGWTGDDSATVTTAAGDYYESTSALSTQLSNSLERMYTTSIGGTRSMTDASVWILVKDNLQSAKASGGGQVVLHDGTDNIGFYCNGNDDPGLSLPSYYNCLKLDVSNRAALSNNAYAGSAANLTVSAITGVGYGTIHQSKANGAIDNVWIDASYFIANTSYALTINGGSSGTPETWSDVAGDDVTNGWGMVANLQGSKYDINGSWEWGDTANASSYFTDSNFQVYIDARDMGVGNFLVRTIAGTGTNELVLSNGLFQNLGTPVVWDLSDTDMNVVKFTAITWTDTGTILMPVASLNNRFANNCIFNNCDQVNFSTLHADACIFNGGTDALGSMLLSTAASSANQTNFIFNSDGTGHAIEITAAGTYVLDGFKFNGYSTASLGTNSTPSSGSTDAMIYNNSGGAVTLTIIGGGDNVSVRNAASSTTTVNQSNSITLTGVEANSEVRLYLGTRANAASATELDGVENSSGNVVLTHSSGGSNAYIVIFKADQEPSPIVFTPLPSSDLVIPVDQRTDRTYFNPV